MFSRIAERIKYFLFYVENDWEIGVSKSPIQSFLVSKKLPEINWLKMPRSVFWADPFGIFKDNKYFIFYEEYSKLKKYATINLAVLSADLKILDTRIVIDEGYHLSFPFLFWHNEELFMLPESCVTKKLMVYKCSTFPFAWKREKILLNEPCIDSVLFFENSFWWLIYSKVEADEQKGKFYIRKNTLPFDSWEKCPETQIERASSFNVRNGGSVFIHNSSLFRITQNCTRSYGQSIVINRILSLSVENFKEEAVKELRLTRKDTKGFHTLSACGEFSLLDRRRERLFLKPPLHLIQSLSKKVFTE